MQGHACHGCGACVERSRSHRSRLPQWNAEPRVRRIADQAAPVYRKQLEGSEKMECEVCRTTNVGPIDSSLQLTISFKLNCRSSSHSSQSTSLFHRGSTTCIRTPRLRTNFQHLHVHVTCTCKCMYSPVTPFSNRAL